MTSQTDVWDLFIGDGLAISSALAASIGALTPDVPDDDERALILRLAQQSFTVAAQGLLVGVDDLGRLALAIEKGLDAVAHALLNPAHAIPVLAAAAETLRQAFQILADPDESGARLEGQHSAAIEAARFELESLLPLPGGRSTDAGSSRGRRETLTGYDVPASSLRRPTEGPAAEIFKKRAQQTEAEKAVEEMLATHAQARTDDPEGPAQPEGEIWQPTVEADMVELFFEEVGERLEDLSIKMVELEGRPGDPELVRDVFRDLHTVKGSSAMVGLDAMNRVAHAAEDLVGLVREGERNIDPAVIDALLAALDGLLSIAGMARSGAPITVDSQILVRRLRDPEAPLPGSEDHPGAAEVAVPARAEKAAKQTIRVDFDKLDRLMNLVGELVLGRDGLRTSISSVASISRELGEEHSRVRRHDRSYAALAPQPRSESIDELRRVERVLAEIAAELDQSSDQIESVSGELREQVMKLRMVPVGGVFRKHHRTVRDIGNATGKRIRLITSGEDTELDKLLVESLDEPLMHLIRNACDHGIETPKQRLAAGKPPEGQISVHARHQGNQVVVEISDDGAGIDPRRILTRAIDRGLVPAAEAEALDHREVLELIFTPGFSTADAVSDLSGRGVGMDVVRQTIMTRLKGTIDISSVLREGTTFTLRLPLTLAIIQVLLARAGGEVFAIPLDSIVRTTTRPQAAVERVGNRDVIEVRRRQVPLISLAHTLELPSTAVAADPLHIVLSEQGDELYGLVCDALVEKKEIVIKPLGDLLEGTPCASGATLLGDKPALILDVHGVIRRAQRHGSGVILPDPGEPSAASGRAPASEREAARILLVEDSETVRESLRRLLEHAGYQVTLARDGVEGLELAMSSEYDLISTDVMMPRMDGYELTRRLRNSEKHRDVPIVMVTSRGERIDRVRGFDAGVDEYITKPHDRHQLIRTVRKLLGDRR